MKNYRRHRIHVCGFLAVLPVLGSVCPLSAAQTRKQAQPLKPQKLASTFLDLNLCAITAIDVKKGTLKVGWLDQPGVTLHELVITKETRFKRAESGIKSGEIKVGDVLLAVKHENFDPKMGNASFTAQDLIVRSLSPLTLDFNIPWSASGNPKLKPGQTLKEAMVESADSNEITGIGVLVPYKPRLDPKTRKVQRTATIVLPQPNQVTFTRPATTKPLAIRDFAIGQKVTFDATTRPDGKLTATTIWLIEEKSRP